MAGARGHMVVRRDEQKTPRSAAVVVEIIAREVGLWAGNSLAAGLCVAFIAITADRLIQAWSRRRKAQLGIA